MNDSADENQDFDEFFDDSFDDLEDIEIDDELNSGIMCLDRAYRFDKRVKGLVEPFKRAINFMKEHTDLSEVEIIYRIDSNIMDVELKDGYKENPVGVGYVNPAMRLFSVNTNVLEKDPESIYTFMLHEMTHMIGNTFVPRFLIGKPISVSGYSRERIYDENSEKENEAFNEAAVEMFISQNRDYREKKIFDEIPINSNQDFNEGLYCANSNIIHQMLLASGIDLDTFFKGLYDYKTSKSVIKKFPRKLFKKVSRNMDDIFNDINRYFDTDDEILRLEEEGSSGPFEELEKKKDDSKADFISKVSENERLIIDKVLLPRLRRIPISERQAFLDKYYQFLICEKDYFKQVTGYKMITKLSSRDDDIFKHYDVEPLPTSGPAEKRERTSDSVEK